MKSFSYFPNYYSIEDILVTQERIECEAKTKISKMGFLNPGNETEDLEVGQTVSFPLWYIKELKHSNPYFTIKLPNIYKNVYKAVCEADTTNFELGKLHHHFYEFGRYLTPFDNTQTIGRIVYETCRQRIRYLLDIAKNTTDDIKPDNELENIEIKLYETGLKTNSLFKDWLQLKSNKITASDIVHENTRKRKRAVLSDDEIFESSSKK